MPSPGAQRVLVIHNNPDAAQNLAFQIRLMGHEAGFALSGCEALRMALGLRPNLVLLDLGLADTDGLAIARQLRLQPGLHNVRVIAVTACATDEDRARSAAAGVDRHYVKPLDQRTVNELLSEVSCCQR